MQNYFFQLGFAVSKQLHKGRTEHWSKKDRNQGYAF
jgi:hypothetical protein